MVTLCQKVQIGGGSVELNLDFPNRVLNSMLNWPQTLTLTLTLERGWSRTAPVETHEQDTRPQRTRRMPTHFVDYRLDRQCHKGAE